MGFVKKLLLSFGAVLYLNSAGWAAQSITFQNNTLELRTQGGVHTVQLDNPRKRNRAGGCVSRGYTLDDTHLHLEYIRLRSTCGWNGLASSIYHGFLREQIGALQVVQRYESGEYKIVLYEKKGKRFYYLSSDDAGSVVFLLDYSGEIAGKVCKRCEPIATNRRFANSFEKSLVHYNFTGKYFSKESSGRHLFIIP